MADYKLPQHDGSPLRGVDLALMQQFYSYEHSVGIPLSRYPDGVRDTDGPEWLRQLLDLALRLRHNMKLYMDKTPFKFANPYPPDITNAQFLGFVGKAITTQNNSLIQNFMDTGSNVLEFVLPDMGPGGPCTSIQQYKDLFITIDLPEIAERFDSDESFGHAFVAGPNPGILQRMTAIPTNFPISNLQLRTVPEFQNDDLDQAIAEGRVFFVDHSSLSVLENGMHYEKIQKYIYAPWAAFVVPKGGGRLYPFAIQCGPTPEGRQLYTPADGYSWKIARNCVLAAHNTHHELSTHLGLTHYLLEPILVATRRQLAKNHPVYALLNHHFEGTMLINFGATHNLILPTRSVDRLIGASLPSTYKYVASERLNYSFSGNYLPNRFVRNKTDNAPMLKSYPYRDDAMLIWNATAAWMNDFVQIFYPNEGDVRADTELQKWAKEVVSPDGGAMQDFGQTPGRIQSRKDLAEILTMIAFTAGPQHAAVNFAQGSDMKFTPANPLAGFQPEPKGLGHSEQDYLNHLPPIEVAISTIDILSILAGVHYTTYGHYFDDDTAVMWNFDSGAIRDAVARFQNNLAAIETKINNRNQTRLTPYVHLLPSRIPQSVNI